MYIKDVVFWDVTLRRSWVNRRFGGTYRPHLPPKRRLAQDLHSATSKKKTFFIVTAVKTSNLTWMYIISASVPLSFEVMKPPPVDLTTFVKRPRITAWSLISYMKRFYHRKFCIQNTPSNAKCARLARVSKVWRSTSTSRSTQAQS
jgi:hypothetical protein